MVNEFKTYHCLFILSGGVVTVKIRTNRGLSSDIARVASLILVDPDPQQFMKDRFDLVGEHAWYSTEEDVRHLIESRMEPTQLIAFTTAYNALGTI